MDNFNEVLAKAKSGALDAMEQLVTYYREQNDEGNALEWEVHYNATRSATFALMSMGISKMGAHGALNIGAWDEVENDWNEIFNHARDILISVQKGEALLDSESIASASEMYNDACYGLALVAYMRDNNYQRVVEMLNESHNHDTKAKVLLGLGLFNTGNYEDAYAVLNTISQDRAYANLEKDALEESLYAAGLHNLSNIYRIGLPGTVQQNLDSAVSILNMAISVIRDAEFRKILQDELSHYKKKLFGGYQYR